MRSLNPNSTLFRLVSDYMTHPVSIEPDRPLEQTTIRICSIKDDEDLKVLYSLASTYHFRDQAILAEAARSIFWLELASRHPAPSGIAALDVFQGWIVGGIKEAPPDIFVLNKKGPALS